MEGGSGTAGRSVAARSKVAAGSAMMPAKSAVPEFADQLSAVQGDDAARALPLELEAGERRRAGGESLCEFALYLRRVGSRYDLLHAAKVESGSAPSATMP